MRHFVKIISFCILIPGNYSAQNGEPQYTLLNTNDGLPSSEVYCALQDQEGYLWFSSDRGVSRFNGYEFENYTTKDGLLNNVVFRMFEDHTGRIWFIDMYGELSYFHNDNIYPFKHNHVIKKTYHKTKPPIPFM